jgi:hypothetical protein
MIPTLVRTNSNEEILEHASSSVDAGFVESLV